MHVCHSFNEKSTEKNRRFPFPNRKRKKKYTKVVPCHLVGASVRTRILRTQKQKDRISSNVI